MSEGLARARQLVTQLDFPAAQQLLRDLLTRAQQDPADADVTEADIAILYAGVLLHLSEPHTARTWATYAHSAMRRLHGERDRRTLHALGVLAVTEHRAGALDRATRHYQQLVTALSAVDGPDGDRTLAARADASFVEHARGLCSSARSQLTEVISVHRDRHGPAHPVGVRMLVRLAGMWRDCGDFDRAHQLLAQARANASVLPPEDETHRVLSMAARAAADQSHQCGVESTRPGSAGQPGVFPVLVVPEPQDFIAPSRMVATTPQITEWPEDEILDGPPAAPRAQPGYYVPPAEPAPASASAQQPSYLPPPTPPAVVFAQPRQIPPPVPRPLALRQQPPPKKPKRQRSGSLMLVAIGAAAAAAIASVAVAIVLSDRNQPQAAPPAASTSPSASPSAAAPPIVVPSGPVSNLKLTDQGDRLLITWIYPANADGPIIVSAAKAGEPMRALQSLPAGTESLTLPGLDPQRDYCVTVTVAYSSEHMVMAPSVCTDRKRPSASP